jgi:hypothetical protein
MHGATIKVFTGDCYLHNVEPNDLRSSSNTLPVVKYRRIMGEGGHVTRTGKSRGAYKEISQWT